MQLLKHSLTEARLQVEQLEQLAEERPNTYDSAANCEVEAAVKQVIRILRTNKLDLEKHIERDILFDYPIMAWLAECAAWMNNIRVVGADGAVAFEIMHRRPFHKRLLPFGELVHVHLPLDGTAQARRGAMGARAVDGVMLGYSDVSHSYFVWLPHLQQVRPMRSITRLPLSQRWSASAQEAITATKRD